MSHPVVATRSGLVRGFTLAADAGARRSAPVHVFKGIPYAASTAGDGRFAAPSREAAWEGERDGGFAGSIAPQQPSPLESLFGADAEPWSEDCLFLNVWTPGCDDARRPVMVWIHGGAFVNGSGSTPWYDGARFAANHDVVLVTINYRMGAFGWLHLTDLAPDEPGVVSNAGLLDQVAALRWVQECITAFGGDTGNVTIFGESAGAMSVGTLLGTPAASGLFRRAILQSGAAANVNTPERATQVAAAVLTHLGLTADAAGVRALRDIDADRLLEASGAAALLVDAGSMLPFQPIAPTPELPVAPLEAVRAGSAAGVDILFGTTRDEMRLFTMMDPSIATIDRDEMVRRVTVRDDARAAAIVDGHLAERNGEPASEVWPDIATDMVFRRPAHELALAVSSGGGRVWEYEFTYATPAFGGLLRSCHALEIPFVFDNLDAPGATVFVGDGDGLGPIASVANEAWAAFARSGDPNGADLPVAWPPFDASARPVFVLDRTCRVDHDPRGGLLRLWGA